MIISIVCGAAVNSRSFATAFIDLLGVSLFNIHAMEGRVKKTAPFIACKSFVTLK